MQKELYVTENNLSEKTQIWTERAFADCGRHRTEICKLKSALIVIDMQKHFTDSASAALVPASRAIAPRIEKLVKYFKLHGIPVFATRHGHELGDNFPFDFVWKNLLFKNSENAKLSLDCLVPEDVEIIDKSTYSAFQDTELDQKLGSLNIKQLFLVGVTTHLCVESTARDAFSKGYLPVILTDCAAAWTERQHLSGLVSMASGIGTIAESSEILADCCAFK